MVAKTGLYLALAATTLASAVPQLPSNDGFISFPIQYRQRVKSLDRRDATATLFNISVVSYLIELDIGTPAQSVKVAIDTGSDELWVDPDCTSRDLTRSQEQECELAGIYDPNSSSSATIFRNSSSILYGTGQVDFDYVMDTIALANTSTTLTNVQFGVATDSQQLSEGILGLGWGNGKNLNYSNFIDSLAEQKVTNSRAFSVALGSADADNGGVIIFGGVDTKKFSGSLVSNKMLGPQNNELLNRYWLQMTSVGLETSSSSKTYTGGDVAVVLDTGSSLSYLPSTVVDGMARDFGAVYSQQADMYIMECAAVNQTGNVTFAFNGVTIRIPMSDFVIVADTSGQYCALGAASSDGLRISALLGDTFLRSAYVVFDQTENTISMAQYANCGQSEQSIPSTGVSGVTGTCDSSASSTTSSSPSASTSAKNAAGQVTYSTAGLGVALFAALLSNTI